MAGIGPEDLHDLAEELLAACVESLDTIPTFAPALGGAPERSFISPGLPVWDCCEQLTVHTEFVIENDTSPGGLATGRRAVHGRINLVGLVASLTRCIPVIGGLNSMRCPTPMIFKHPLRRFMLMVGRCGTTSTTCSERERSLLAAMRSTGKGCERLRHLVAAQDGLWVSGFSLMATRSSLAFASLPKTCTKVTLFARP